MNTHSEDDEPVISGKRYKTTSHLTFEDAEFIRDCWDQADFVKVGKGGPNKDPEVVQLLMDKFEIEMSALKSIVEFRVLGTPPWYSKMMMAEGVKKSREASNARGAHGECRSIDEQAAHFYHEHRVHT